MLERHDDLVTEQTSEQKTKQAAVGLVLQLEDCI